MASKTVTLDKPVVFNRDGHTVIHIPMTLKRMGGRKQVIVPNGFDGSAPNKSPVQRPLAIAVARAQRWKDLLDRQHFPSISSLADALNQDPSYVMRVLRLTLLAPDIIEDILNGNEPSGSSLEKLTKTLPMEWEKQRKMFDNGPILLLNWRYTNRYQPPVAAQGSKCLKVRRCM